LDQEALTGCFLLSFTRKVCQESLAFNLIAVKYYEKFIWKFHDTGLPVLGGMLVTFYVGTKV